jgi:hypothetical protein
MIYDALYLHCAIVYLRDMYNVSNIFGTFFFFSWLSSSLFQCKCNYGLVSLNFLSKAERWKSVSSS